MPNDPTESTYVTQNSHKEINSQDYPQKIEAEFCSFVLVDISGSSNQIRNQIDML